jgi:hypothetical protein
MRQEKRSLVPSQEISSAIAKLYAQYGKYALPDEEARKIVDEALGTKTLTEVLDSMREG